MLEVKLNINVSSKLVIKEISIFWQKNTYTNKNRTKLQKYDENVSVETKKKLITALNI
jgi:hypothetical protein